MGKRKEVVGLWRIVGLLVAIYIILIIFSIPVLGAISSKELHSYPTIERAILNPLSDAKFEVNYTINITGTDKDVEVFVYFYPRNVSTQKVLKLESNLKRENGYFVYRGKGNRSMHFWISAIIEKVHPKVFDELLYAQETSAPYEISEDISKIAIDITRESRTKLEAASKINKWVIENINYEEKEPYVSNFIPPDEVIKQKAGVCDELAGVMIAMLNAIGIEARMVSGLAYSSEKRRFIPHAWVEAKINGKWIPFDPSYSEFSDLDPSHLAFSFDYNGKEVVVNYVAGENINIKTDYKINLLYIKSHNISVNLRPLTKKIGSNSYGVLELEVDNILDNYFVDYYKLYSAKEVEFLNRDVIVIASPKEKKKKFIVFFLNKSLEPGYIYTYPIVASSTTSNASTSFEASNTYVILSYEDVKSYIEGVAPSRVENILCNKNKIIGYVNKSFRIKCFFNGSLPKEYIEVETPLKIKDINYSKRGIIFVLEGKISRGKKGYVVIIKRKGTNRILGYGFIETVGYMNNGLEINLSMPQQINVSSVFNAQLKIYQREEDKSKNKEEGSEESATYYNLSIKVETPLKEYITKIATLENPLSLNIPMRGDYFYIGKNNVIINMTYYDALGKKWNAIKKFEVNVKAENIREKIKGIFKFLIYKLSQII